MKGLFLNNYYSSQEGLKISVLLSVLIVILSLFVNDSIATATIGIIIFIFPTNNITSLQTDEASKWNKFEITTPVSRYQIILTKYISYLGTVLFGVICSLGVVLTFFVRGRQLNLSSLFYSYLFGISLSLLLGAILYPLLLRFGALKAELFTVISAILSVALIFIIWATVNKFFFTVDFKSVTTGIIICISSLICFILSFWKAKCIYMRKEF